MSGQQTAPNVQELFEAALALEPTRRAAFLHQACADAPTVRAEVEDLLRSFEHARTSELFPPLLHSAPDPSSPGQRLGPYRLLRAIGEGGMGAVYLAEREDVEMRAALKLVRDGRLASSAQLQRFLLERRVLARLEHPNIARLLDAGVTEQGLPYLVMEYVEGEPLDRYCEAHQLSLEERLRLFLEVCRAVHYAHQNLVVHRDLKPSNILVSAEGRVKLLDFGIAKLLGVDEPTEAGVTLTRAGGLMLTPEYASPEQIRGESVTTASDVYSLGVVLYELLAGQRPYRIQGHTPAELQEVIGHTEPQRPSLAVLRAEAEQEGKEERVRLGRRLRGDLDAIVLKALRKEAERRYPSVRELEEDVQRHLEGLPVRARGDVASYRVRKFLRRHRAGVVAAGVVALSLVGGIVATTMQAQRAEAERARAERQARVAEVEREKAEQINTFLLNMLGAANVSSESPYGARVGPQTTVAEVIDGAARTIGTQLEGQPEVEATLRLTIGIVYRMLGRFDDSRAQVEAALALQRRVHRGPHADIAWSLAELGTGHIQRGARDTALVLLRASREMFRQVGDTTSTRYVTTTANLATLLVQRGDGIAGAALLHEVLAGRRRVHGDVHSSVANTLNNIGTAFNAVGQDDSTEHYQRAAVAVYDRIRGRDYFEHAFALGNVATLVAQREEWAEAERLLLRARGIAERTVGLDNPLVAFIPSELASVHHRMGRHEEALAEIDRVLALLDRTVAPTHREVARARGIRAHILVALGRAAEAEADARRALEIVRGMFPGGNYRVHSYESIVGHTLSAQGRFAEAEPILLQAYQRIEADVGPRHISTRQAARRLAMHYEAKGDPGRAATYRALAAPPRPTQPASGSEPGGERGP